jgi:hypothetical protein
MSRLSLALAICLSLIYAGPNQVSADVHVKPRRNESSILLDGIRTTKGSKHHSHVVVDEKRPQQLKFRCSPGGAGLTNCSPDGDAPSNGRPAKLTEGAILTAVREIGLPSLRVRIQPGTSTLVNVRTIFYTRPEPFRRSITLLGYDIDLVADPIHYTWHHGDGTTSTTTRPGKPYPSMEVTYRYREPADTVNPRVDVTYRVHYRVDGGGWNTIGQTLLASGPTAALKVKEAAPVLTSP